MSPAANGEKGYQLVPTWWPILTVVVSVVFAVGGAHATNTLTNSHQDKRLDGVEKRLDAIESIDRRLARIEGKLGINP